MYSVVLLAAQCCGAGGICFDTFVDSREAGCDVGNDTRLLLRCTLMRNTVVAPVFLPLIVSDTMASVGDSVMPTLIRARKSSMSRTFGLVVIARCAKRDRSER